MAIEKISIDMLDGEITINETYVIDLTEWGITEGLPTKGTETIGEEEVTCYSDIAYTNALNNILGINAALAWAVSEGYTKVIMPKGNYAVCYSYTSTTDYENQIVIRWNNLTFDLGGSTFKVLYDSAKRSPYDKKLSGGNWITNDAAIYAFYGAFMLVRDCNFVNILNGTVIGDKYDRLFTEQAEKAAEHTRGITTGGNCKYIKVANIDISGFMGDNLSNSSTGVGNTFAAVGYQMGWALGDINSTTGEETESTDHCVSDAISVSENSQYFLQGYGYTQGMTQLTNKKYAVYCYETDNTYIMTLGEIFVLRSFTTPKNTAKVKLVVEESALDTDGTGGWEMTLTRGVWGEFVTYENCKIHHGHRGGVLPGKNEMTIKDNHFYNNGESYDYENDLPGFEKVNGQPYLTRYHINMEDVQGFNINIIHNLFESSPKGRLGIAVRGWNYIINDNVFKNCSQAIYRLHYMQFKNNYLDNSGFGTYEYNDYYRHWNVENNVFNGEFVISGTSPIDSVCNNVFSSKFSTAAEIYNFSNNTFYLDTYYAYTTLVNLANISVINNCAFVKTESIKSNMGISSCLVNNSTFSNVKIFLAASYRVVFKNCKFVNCSIHMSTGEVIFDGCDITHGVYTQVNDYAAHPHNDAFLYFSNNTAGAKVYITNRTKIVSSNEQPIFSNFNTAVTNCDTSLWVENSYIEKQDYDTVGLDNMTGTFDFINSTFVSEIAYEVTPSAAVNHRFAECTFTGITLNTKAGDIVYSRADLANIES